MSINHSRKDPRINVSNKPTTRRDLDVCIFSRSSARVSMFTKRHFVFVAQTFVCNASGSVRAFDLASIVGASRLAASFFLKSIWIGDARQLSSFGLSSADPTFSEVPSCEIAHFALLS
jgi:hypothetical protein